MYLMINSVAIDDLDLSSIYKQSQSKLSLTIIQTKSIFYSNLPSTTEISLINPNMYLLEEEHLTNIFFKQIVVIEGSNRLGGWIQSERLQDGTVFEGGPRSFRFGGKVEAKTLELVSNTQLPAHIKSNTSNSCFLVHIKTNKKFFFVLIYLDRYT